MTYRVLKSYKPHNFAKGDLVGIPAKYVKFIEELKDKGIIEELDTEETKVAFDELKGKEEDGTII